MFSLGMALFPAKATVADRKCSSHQDTTQIRNFTEQRNGKSKAPPHKAGEAFCRAVIASFYYSSTAQGHAMAGAASDN